MRLIWRIHHPPYVLMLALFDDVSKSMSHLYPYLYKPIFVHWYLTPYVLYMGMKSHFDMGIFKIYEIFCGYFYVEYPQNGYFIYENIQFIKKIILYFNFLYVPYNMASYIQKSSKVMWPKSCDWNHVTVIIWNRNSIEHIKY